MAVYKVKFEIRTDKNVVPKEQAMQSLIREGLYPYYLYNKAALQIANLKYEKVK